jgi:hypothetical protein
VNLNEIISLTSPRKVIQQNKADSTSRQVLDTFSFHPVSIISPVSSHSEKEVDDKGQLQTLRILNGDETRSGEFLIMPNNEPDYGGFPIAVTIPAKTCIAEVEAYYVIEEDDD